MDNPESRGILRTMNDASRILIVGGGLNGPALALALAQGGHAVTVIDALPEALDRAIDALAPGGRLAVLSYHSGEDRIAKERIRVAVTGGCECPPELPCVCGAVQTVRVVRAPKRPGSDEQAANRRAASARLRVAEKLAPADEAVR